MNRYPLWKNLLVLALALVGALYALPNLYGKDPAVLVSSVRAEPLDAGVRGSVEGILKDAGITYRFVRSENGKLQVTFAEGASQLKASERLEATLGQQYVVAQDLAPATPQWLRAINGRPMYLGLDLQGGIHFLMEVDMRAAVATEMERFAGEIKTLLREKTIRHMGVRRDGNRLRIRFRGPEARDEARDEIVGKYNELVLGESEQGGYQFLEAMLTPAARSEARENALQQNITTLRNRVNELGVAEPVIQRQGENRIVVELPGVQDPTKAKDILGATATLEFRLVAPQNRSVSEIAQSGRVPPGTELFRTREGRPVLLNKRVILTGDSITHAASTIDQRSGTPAVVINLDSKGGRRFDNVTKDHVGDDLAVVYIETKVLTDFVEGKRVKRKETTREVISVATIRERLGRRFQIEGLDSTDEAHDLALLLRAGALAAPIEIVEERTVGPSLGRDNINQGFNSVVIGFIAVLLFMAVYYRSFGLIADVALTVNLVLIVALLSLLQATLTLPGIAGIVLTVGMAVDANVLIFERIREELRNGNTPQASIHAGYEKAFSTIADANITTLIAALVLFGFGTGPIKGFAVTLSLGILTSMFTAIMGTRAMVNLAYGGRRVQRLAI
ncbi:MAG: protein translocase subunit SecD [Gammaproteobacteria bacterium]|nr:protein translocase subunit SecD [Gammaproteobacteria bacterium]NIR97923.1 protein translocase subunit SecD [Gammaproteobacteria bacterium]NIT63628.1 protein translocase subunit SecD [Gammaproteobacteria bacterium]NIV20564.1 protein translocase subunit SecD [Gammaproteobacteria bacterium]NIX11158.1 protein translocase subunit SecD [Gammaproteobacteria bacterium]